MLKRELYKGDLVWNRLKFEKVPEPTLSSRSLLRRCEWIRTQRPELAIVSAELWDSVQHG
jgi:site-specific DNA recombinase